MDTILSNYILNFGNTSGAISTKAVSPLQKGTPMLLSEFFREFNCRGYIAINGKSAMLNEGSMNLLSDFGHQDNTWNEDVFLALLDCSDIEEKLEKLNLRTIAIDADEISYDINKGQPCRNIMTIGHTERKNLNKICMENSNLSIINSEVYDSLKHSSGSKKKEKYSKDAKLSTPMFVSFGIMPVINDKDSTYTLGLKNAPSDKIFYDAYNLDGLSGSPVMSITSYMKKQTFHLEGVHIGESPNPDLRMGQKINFTKLIDFANEVNEIDF